MLKLFRPCLCLNSIHELDFEELKKKGIKGLVFDLDNTLVGWNCNDFSTQVVDWLTKAKNLGFKLCIVSNNRKARVKKVANLLGIPAIARAGKPRKRPYTQVQKIISLPPQEIAFIGDQLFTDVLGGNRMGFYTVLVLPLHNREFVGTRIVRKVEKLVMNRLRRKGLI